MGVDIKEPDAFGWHVDGLTFAPWHFRELEEQKVI